MLGRSYSTITVYQNVPITTMQIVIWLVFLVVHQHQNVMFSLLHISLRCLIIIMNCMGWLLLIDRLIWILLRLLLLSILKLMELLLVSILGNARKLMGLVIELILSRKYRWIKCLWIWCFWSLIWLLTLKVLFWRILLYKFLYPHLTISHLKWKRKLKVLLHFHPLSAI